MRRVFSLGVVAYLILLLLLELCWLPFAAGNPWRIALLYLMILYAAFEWNARFLIPLAGLIGLFRDLTGSLPFGTETLALFSSAWALRLVVPKIERGLLLVRLLTAFVYLATVPLLIAGFSGVLGGPAPLAGSRLGVIIGSALLSTAVLPLFFYMTGRWFGERSVLKQYELFG